MPPSDAPRPAGLRRLVHKAFAPRRVEALRGCVQELCDDMLARARRLGAAG